LIHDSPHRTHTSLLCDKYNILRFCLLIYGDAELVMLMTNAYFEGRSSRSVQENICFWGMVWVCTRVSYIHEVQFYSSVNITWLLTLAVLWLWGFPAYLSRQRPGFDPRTVHVEFVLDKVTAKHIFEYLDLCQYHPPTIRIHRMIYHRRCVISDIDSALK
jgi:hypothetical protein